MRISARRPLEIAIVVALAAAPWLLSCGGTAKPPVIDTTDRTTPVPETAVPTEADSSWGSPVVEPWAIDPEGLPPGVESPAAIRIGVLAPFSGPYAAYGKAFLDGAHLAAENAAQTLGQGIDLMPADTQGDAIAALEAVRHLIDQDDVQVILGGILSLPTLIAGVEANAHAVPMLSNVASEDGIRRIGPHVFHQVPSISTEARAAADLATFDLRSFRAAVLSPEQGEGRTLATAFSEQFVALGGQVVASETYAAGTTDFNRMVRRIRASQPDLLYLPVPVEDALLLAPALGFQGIDVPILGTTHWQSERLLQMTGIDLEGAMLPGGLPQDATPVLDDFERLYLGRFGMEPNRFAAAGYTAARRVLEVFLVDPQSDRQHVQEALALRFGGGFESNAPMPFLVVREGALKEYAAP